MISNDYYDTFYPAGPEAEMRLAARMRTLCGLIDLPLEVIPQPRDGWVERYVSEDDPNRGHLLIAIYTQARLDITANAVGVFAMRAHRLYYSERDDTVQPTYLTFYFRVPAAEFSPSTLASLVGAAVAPVDTDARWATALGSEREGTS